MKKTIGIYAYTRTIEDSFGGVESQVKNISKELLKKGFRVAVHCLANSELGLSVENGAFVFSSKVISIDEDLLEFHPMHGPGFSGCIEENLKVSKEYHEQMILAYGTRDGFVFNIAVAVKEELKIQLISFVYFTAEERWFRSLVKSHTRNIAGISTDIESEHFIQTDVDILKNVINKSDKIIVPTNYVKGQLSQLSSPVEISKIRVVYHGVPSEIFNYSEKDLGFSGDWLFVARLSNPFALHKNFLWLCEFYKLFQHHKEFQDHNVVILGDGNGSVAINKFLYEAKIDEKINVIGFCNQIEVASYFRKSSILLIPSMMEAGCTVIIEAVLCGCLPIVLDFAGSSEIMEKLMLNDLLVSPQVKTRGNLTLIEPHDDEFLEKILDVYRNPNHYKGLLLRASEIAKQFFQIDVTTKRLIGHLNLTEF